MVLAACQPSAVTPATRNTPTPRLTPVVTVYTLPPTPTPQSGWRVVAEGVEFMRLTQRVNDADDWVSVVRIDATRANLSVRYAPANPLNVRLWHADANTDAVINAGFFTEDMQATGLIIADGKSFGRTYRGFGGMLSVRGGVPRLQWLAQEPYAVDGQITQAVQSFPMLVVDGRIVDGIPDNGSRNRRSFVAMDTAGRVLLGVCFSPVWTLTDLARFLQADARLDISAALNLDGGGSTGMWVRGVPDPQLLNSVEAVPSVIIVNGR